MKKCVCVKRRGKEEKKGERQKREVGRNWFTDKPRKSSEATLKIREPEPDGGGARL